MKKNKIQHVYIIGSKGIPAKYGGFETFVEKLTENNISSNIKYHVACMEENSLKSDITEKHFIYNNADCFNISVPSIGPAKAIYYDIKSLDYAIHQSKKNKDERPIFYVLACRIGPFINYYKKKIAQLNGKLFVNPDGHEWLREKWSYPVRKYWKHSERLMVKYSDLLICDSVNIEKYIKDDYRKYTPKTTYIAYGTDTIKSNLISTSSVVRDWFHEKKINSGEYYLVVGRFVPENNYESIIKEFMVSNTKKNLVIITNFEKNKFYNKLQRETSFEKDSRIKFVGTVYDQELLKYIRENAFAYIHGHEVGGTNPSLLEAMSFTPINLLIDVAFNEEVGLDGALYWEKDNLHKVINTTELFTKNQILDFESRAKDRVRTNYSWPVIIEKYEKNFLGVLNG